MPEQLVIYRNRVEVTEDDQNNAQLWRQDALDNVVFDAIIAENRYTGFGLTAPTTTSVTVAAGRLYFGGQVYFNNTPGGTTLDLSSVKPALQSRYVAIVAAPKVQDTDLQQRDFEVDAATETYEPQTVAMLRQRWADLQAVAGLEAVSPIKPTVPNTAVVIGYVLMTPAGIGAGAITQLTDNIAPNLGRVSERTGVLEDGYETVSAKTQTISDDLAHIAQEIAGLAGLQMLASMAQDIARLKVKANLPAVYVNYRQNDFIDDSLSNTAYPGRAAKVSEGLRFPDAAVDQTQLQVFNPFNPLAKISAAGLLLPAYINQIFRIVRGVSGTMSLSQYSYQTYSMVQATMSRSRIRYGAEFEEAIGSAFFAGGTLGPALKNFTKDGETFQVYDTGQVNPDGQKIVRLAQYWNDVVSAAYWQRVVTTSSPQGYAWGQTFKQQQSGWCTGISPKINAKSTTASLTLGICGTLNGQPDLTNVIAQVTLNPADVVVEAPLGSWIVPIEPTYLQAGERYCYFLITGGDYVVNVADATNNGGGTCFYALDGGVFYPNPSQNIMFDLAFASFTQNQVAIDLGALSLNGGISAIDILASSVVPADTIMTYEIQVNGNWIALAEASASALASLPPLVPLRVRMTGTGDLMPALMLAGSVCKVSRPATAFKEATIVETLASASTKITVKSTLIDFEPAHHTYTAKISAGGSLRVPDTTTDVVVDDRTIERSQVFNLGTAVTSYVAEYTGGTDSAANLFHVASTFELA